MPYILKKRIKGRTYYYLAETKRVQGKPRIVWQKYLGTAEKIRERFEGMKTGERIAEIETFEMGSIAAIEAIEKELGFEEIVDRIVPKRHRGMSVSRYLYLIALNRAVEPKSKASLGAWFRTTAIGEYREIDWAALDSANFWDHMEKVRKEEIEAIGDEVAKRVVTTYDLSLDCLLYDTTNYFTQMSPKTESELAGHTHSKAGKHELRHVGLALLCNRQEGIPLFHRVYPANIHDSKLFHQLYSEMHGLLFSLWKGKEQMTLVFDKGCNSPENIETLDGSRIWFIGTLSPYHHPGLCQVPLSEYRNLPIRDEEGEPLSAYRTSLELYGKERAVVVTYNPLTYRRKIHWLSRTIRTHPLVLKEYKTRFGKNILFTDHIDWSTEEIVRAYRDRYKIETAFRWTKDPTFIRWQPMYHWTDSKIRVHGLTCVMALLYLSLLHRKLKTAGLAISLDRAMEILRAVRLAICFYPNSSQPVRKVCRLGSTEQELLTALDLRIGAVR